MHQLQSNKANYNHLIAESDSRLLCFPPDYRIAQCLMVVRSWCIPPVNSSSWWSDLGASHQSAQCLMAVRSWCIPPVSTELHGSLSQILVMVVRSWCIPPVSTEPHGGQILVMVVRSWCIPPVSKVPQGGQILVHPTSQHRASWQ